MTPRKVYELVASVRELDAETAQQRLERYLSSLDAASAMGTVIATLSRGNRQKVQIIAALHWEHGSSVLFSTHIPEVAAELCTTIAIIGNSQQGRHDLTLLLFLAQTGARVSEVIE